MKPPTPSDLTPEQAWDRIPLRDWGPEEAAHFLRRVTFSATPDAVARAVKGSVVDATDRAFSGPKILQKSAALEKFSETEFERYRAMYREKDDQTKRKLRQELQREDNELFNEYALSWFIHARQPENSATEKLVLFLQDVFVVERNRVKEITNIHNFQQTIRSGIDRDYPDLCKRISREPAMIRYLDLIRSTKKKPNENFARELFELFTLGEGNYTEDDIKEASRAFTGYRIRNRNEFWYQSGAHDVTEKTVFGETGNWEGDDIVDLAFKQPSARTFLVREFLKFYLSDTPVHEDYIVALGDKWADRNFSLRFLVDTVFQSRLFYHGAFRGNLVKSPIQFYIGLCQDLRLDVIPFDGRLLRSFNAMGQSFYNPPNVRGWLYGEHWINSTTISARRQVVDYVFAPLNEKKLNGNEKRDLEAARKAGRGDFLVTKDRIERVLQSDTAGRGLAKHFCTYFITAPSRTTYYEVLSQLIGDPSAADAPKKVRNAVIALLQSPAYNLC